MELNFSGEFKVAQPREQVFRTLADPQKFAPLLPAFQSVEKKDDRTVLVKVKVGIGRISGTAATELRLEESEAPRRARYVGKGKVMQGAYQVDAAFDLEDITGGTLVKWRGDTLLVGRILSLAGGGLRGYAEKEIRRLIASLQQCLAPGFVPGPAARPAAESWLARITDILRRLLRMKPAAPPSPVSSPIVVAEGLATYPEDTRNAQRDATKRIQTLLNVKRDGKKGKRKEDNRLVRGRGLFVDDYRVHGLLHMAVVRSPHAHARIHKIDVSRAQTLPGVVCTLTGDEIAAQCDPFPQIGAGPSANIKDYPLAVGKARHQGDPVAVVIAETPRLAEDAAELVEVEYEILPPVITVEQALKGDVTLHEEAGTNTTFRDVFEYGDVDPAFREAAHVIKINKLYFHRFGSTAVETNAIVATWDPRGEIDLFSNTIMTVPLIMLAPALRVSMDQIRLRTHDIGGSFGNKICNYPYIATAALASRKAGGRPVKWVETRSEHMQCGGHGSERSYYDTEVALDKDGVITALRSRHVDDCGAFPRYEPLGCVIWSQTLPAAYRLRNIRIDFSQVLTNKGPCAPNRGYSRTPHIWFMERVIDICGHELG
ncbi:MAG: molybdopterin cofactor-binding domain-containing protein, partial [Gammaproteobacteria bacterium]